MIHARLLPPSHSDLASTESRKGSQRQRSQSRLSIWVLNKGVPGTEEIVRWQVEFNTRDTK